MRQGQVTGSAIKKVYRELDYISHLSYLTAYYTSSQATAAANRPPDTKQENYRLVNKSDQFLWEVDSATSFFILSTNLYKS